MNIPIKLLSPKAKIPTRGSKCAAGLDLYASEDYSCYPGERIVVKTDICIKIPDGYYGRIAPRSGLALKQGIMTMAGVIDSDYLGEIKVILFNANFFFSGGKLQDHNRLSQLNLFRVAAGDRIAQLIIEKYYDFPFVEVNNLGDSERQDKGFGSSGK